jgi:hypothetical protein
MNFLRKIFTFSLAPDQSNKKLVDFILLLVVCFMIVLYKVIKS